MTLAFNFAMVEPKFDNIQDAFQRYVNKVINDFLERYSQYFANEKISEIRSYVKIDEKLQELFFLLRTTSTQSLYVHR